MLSEDKDLEYYRNRCGILEEEIRQLRKKIASLEETVSALVARNINARPDKKPHNDTAKKQPGPQTTREKAGPDHPIQTVP